MLYVQCGCTALLVACEGGRLDVIRWLIATGIDVQSERSTVR
jgi:hypothetical protein